MSKRLVKKLIFTIALLGSQAVQANWTTNGKEASFAIYLPQTNKPETHAIFVVSYEKQWKCNPTAAVVLLSGRTLGAATKQATAKAPKNQLHIVVDDRAFNAETKLTTYSNGMELAMFAPSGLIEALERNPRTVIARLGRDHGGFDFSDGRGFAAANAAAKRNCS
jgi:hypothetical protein